MADEEGPAEDFELEEELDDDLDGAFDDDGDDEGEDAADGEPAEDADEEGEDGAEGVEIPSGANPAKDADDDVHLGEDDVEASLDIILKEKLVVDEETDEEAAAEPEPAADGTEQVQPRQADEFVCKSCFLVKSTNQLADQAAGLCRDCV